MSVYRYITSHIANLMTQYVGKYFEGIEPHKLELAWKGGNLQVNDIAMKPAIMDFVNLPLCLAYSSIGSVRVSLPLRNLLSVSRLSPPEPLLIEIQNFYMIVVPKPECEWNEEVFQLRCRFMRKRRLDQSSETLATSSRWFSSVLNRIVEDVKFIVTNVHIRYEYVSPHIDRCFSSGMTLATLEIRTPEETHWKNFLQKQQEEYEPVTLEMPQLFHTFLYNTCCVSQKKMFSITKIAVYWNSGENCYYLTRLKLYNPQTRTFLDDSLVKTILQEIATSTQQENPLEKNLDEKQDHLRYPVSFLLKPFSCSFWLFVYSKIDTPSDGNVTSSFDSSSPYVSQKTYQLWVELQRLQVIVKKNMLKNLTEFIRMVQLYHSLLSCILIRQELYIPYRPEISVKCSPRIWWRYAVSCVIRRLRYEFPETFISKTNVWSFGEDLKNARIQKWRNTFRKLLTCVLFKEDFNTELIFHCDNQYLEEYKEMQHIQSFLPEKDLLEVFVETKRLYLEASRHDGTSARHSYNEKKKEFKFSFSSWQPWFRATPQIKKSGSDNDIVQDEHPTTKTSAPFSLKHGLTSLMSLDDHLYQDCDTCYNISNCSSFPRVETFNKENGFSRSSLKRQSEDKKGDLMRHFLAADETFVTIVIDLQVASIQLELSKSTCLLAGIADVKVQLQIDHTVSHSVTVQDCWLHYLRHDASPQALLSRRDSLSKQLLALIFCGKEKKTNKPMLLLDVRRVIIHWIPFIYTEIAHLLSIVTDPPGIPAESQETLHNSTTFSETSRLVSFSKLSTAKKYMCGHYRNMYIKVLIEAPIIIIPTNSTFNPLLTNCQKPVIAVHLGAISIDSNVTELPTHHEVQETHHSNVQVTSLQRFRVQLNELFLKYLQSADMDEDVTRKSGELVISPFAVQILLVLSIEERHPETFPSGLCETTKNDASILENHHDEATFHYVLRIHGDLPTLTIALNKETYSALMEAVACMIHRQDVNATCGRHVTGFQNHQLHKNTGFHRTVTLGPTWSNFCDECCVFNKTIHEIGVAKRFHSMYTKKSQCHFTKQHAVSPQSGTDDSDSLDKTGVGRQISTSKGHTEVAIPFEVQASFSLLTFQLSVNCSHRFKENVDLVTDRTIIFYQQAENKFFQLKIRDLTLFRTRLSLLSPYYKLLTTYSLATADAPSLQNYVDKEKVMNEDVSKCFIFVDITLSSYNSLMDCHSPLEISVTFSKHVTLFLQPRPLRYFLSFWRYSKPDQMQPISMDTVDKNVVSSGLGQRMSSSINDKEKYFSFDQLVQHPHTANTSPAHNLKNSRYKSVVHPSGAVEWLLDIRVISVSCVCIESREDKAVEKVFAICTFRDTCINLKAFSYGISLFCELQNLMIQDFDAEQNLVNASLCIGEEDRLTLFRVIPGSGSLVTITVDTVDKTCSHFDGVSMNLSMNIGEVEIVCFVGKFLKIFDWIIHSFLSIFLASSPDTVEPTLNFFQKPQHNCHLSPSFDCTKLEYRNCGEKVLLQWMLKALACQPILGSNEIAYLNDIWHISETPYQKNQRKATRIVCPLTLRHYDIRIRSPIIHFPVSLQDCTREIQLTVSFITLSNTPLISQNYGLLDNIQVDFENVTLKSNCDEDALVTDLSMKIEFQRSLLQVSPSHPLYIVFNFSDLAIFLNTLKLRCLLDVITFNILQTNPDDNCTTNTTKDSGIQSKEFHENKNVFLSKEQKQTTDSNTLVPINDTSFFQFTFSIVFVFLHTPLSRDSPCMTPCILRANSFQCRFRKTVQKVKIVDIKALSTRFVHCSTKNSPYCLFLSDSHESLMTSYDENMIEIYNILNNLPLRGCISQWFYDYVSNAFKDSMKSSYVTQQTKPAHHAADCLQCTYRFRSDDFSKLYLKISDVRVILLQQAFRDVYSFLNQVAYENTNKASKEIETTSTDFKKKFNLKVHMVRTCVVLLSSYLIESPLLVMRGNFKLQHYSIADKNSAPSSSNDTTNYCSVEDYTMDVSDVELFVTNLKTLTALEYAQKECWFQQQEALTGVHSTQVNELSFSKSSLVSLSSMLQVPINFLVEDTSYKKLSHPHVNGCSIGSEQTQETTYSKKTCQPHTFNDFIRILCPQVNGSMNVTVHCQPHSLCIRNGVHVVVKIEPVVITLSYSDINCLQRCLFFLHSEQLKNISSSPSKDDHYMDSQNQMRLGNSFPEFKKFSMDLTQVVVTLSDDFEGYTNAPVLQFCTYNGSVTILLDESSLLNKQQLNGTLCVTVNFFNPRAVVYEPVIENLLLNILYEKTFFKGETDQKKKKNSEQEKWKINFFGFKKQILCINLAQSFLINCKKHMSRWKQMRSSYSLDNGETKIVKYCFAPYVIENQCGVPLALLPSKLLNKEPEQERLHDQCSHLFESCHILEPGKICRLSRFGVQDGLSLDKRFPKVSKFSLVFGTTYEYMSGNSLQLERSGVTVYSLISINNETKQMLGPFKKPLSEEKTLGKSQSYIISRVAVVEGQKRLTVESQVMFDIQLCSEWGLAIHIQNETIGTSAIMVIPPFSKKCLPIFSCSHPSTILQFCPFHSKQPYSTEKQQYEWSSSLMLKTLWQQAQWIEKEKIKTLELFPDAFSQNKRHWSNSNLASFLPSQSFMCSTTKKTFSDCFETKFHFQLSVNCKSFVYRETKCQQLTLIFHPSIRLRSVTPLPLNFSLLSHFDTFSNTLPPRDIHLEGGTSGVINLGETIPMYSLPLLEKVFFTLYVNENTSTNCDIGTNMSYKQLIYSRMYPRILSDPDTPLNDTWTQLWIQQIETCMLFQEEANLLIVPILSARNNFKTFFSTHAVLEKLPGQSLCITLFSPTWMISHLSPNFLFQSNSSFIATALTFSNKEENLYAMKSGRLSYETLPFKKSVRLKYAWNPAFSWGYVASETQHSEKLFHVQTNESVQAVEERFLDISEHPWWCPLDVNYKFIGVELIDLEKNCRLGKPSKPLNIECLPLDQVHTMELSAPTPSRAVTEVSIHVTQYESIMNFPVKLLTIVYKCYLHNLTSFSVLFRQQGTSHVVIIPPESPAVPLEWSDASQPRLFHLKRPGDLWYWSGSLCPTTLSTNETFVLHMALKNENVLLQDTSECTLHLEKQLVNMHNNASIDVLVFRNKRELLLRDTLLIINNSTFRVSIWQYRTPVTRGFTIDNKGASVDFSWNDMVAEKSLYISLDVNECKAGVVVYANDLCVANRHLLRFGDALYGTKFWCILLVTRKDSRKVLCLYNYSSSPKIIQVLGNNLQYASLLTSDLMEQANHKSSCLIEILIPSVCFSFISNSSRTYSLKSRRLDKKNRNKSILYASYLEKSGSQNSLTTDSYTQEYICMYFQQFQLNWCWNFKDETISVTIADVQIDNCDSTTLFPVLLQPLGVSSSATLENFELHQLTEGVSLTLDIHTHPLVDIVCVRRLDLSQTGIYSHINFLRVVILGLSIKSDLKFLTITNKFFEDSKKILCSNHPYSIEYTEATISQQLLQNVSYFLSSTTPNSFIRFYFKELVIHPILIRASFRPATVQSTDPNFNTKFHVKSIVMRFLASIGTVQDLPIHFSALKFKDCNFDIYSLSNTLKKFYMKQFWSSSLTVAGNMDFLGNPVSTLSHLGAGLGDLVTESVRAFNINQSTSMAHPTRPTNVLDGIGKGAKSLWDNTVYGAFNVVSKVSGVAAQGLDVLTFDEEYLDEKQQLGARRQPKDASEGLSMGAEAFGKAVVGGLKGLVSEPARAIENRGIEGLAEGVGRGVVGALMKPVAGIFEMASLTAGGIQEAAGESSGVARGRRSRKRPPRVFYGYDQVIRPYSLVDAQINDILLYAPKIAWETFFIENLVYDKEKNYLWIITTEELLTLIIKEGEIPKVHIFCLLWQIIDCNVVTQATAPGLPPLLQQTRPSNQTPVLKTCRNEENSYLATNFKEIPDYTNHSDFFEGGIIFHFQPPLSNQYITTSSLEIAVNVCKYVNDAVQKI
ncbi:uncharacterized protein LOC128882970 isoform X2 [Hylaeus volcanicus]|uniref:uncharacterized protein LOC128882970 isoform X2 n=1 Tax=Hylaeus volcanicus TaxID=313075 RepID=UPI0023B829D1|nr:uncharacterized protein LOC128882970 isoform X2 [Hylaeus volcanicus]